MWRNYLNIAIRNLLRHKVYSLINILGLAIGMACCVLILLFIQHEWSYNRHHEKSARIYKVMRQKQHPNGNTHYSAFQPVAVLNTVQKGDAWVRKVLVVIQFAISIVLIVGPVAWSVMSGWLQNFVYRIDLSGWFFILSTICALLIALLTIGYQAVKAARANPVEALRYE